MISYLNRSHKKFLSIVHGWFFSLSVILQFRADIRIGWFFISVFFQYFFAKKMLAWNFLRSMQKDTVHNLECPVLSIVTFLRFFRRPPVVSASF